MLLEGKAAIITGGGRGLGRASAIAMAKEGASVLILSKTSSELRQVEKAIATSGGTATSIVADVSRHGDIEKSVNRALSTFGKIDILMNNAAVLGPLKPIHQVKRAEWEEIEAINLAAVITFSRKAASHMTGHGGGKIINVTSGLGVKGMSPFGAYSVTKAGVIQLTRIMADELREWNIQVNGLDPGVMDTQMQDTIRSMGPDVLGDDVYAQFMSLKENGYLDPPERAAGLAVFLASGASDGITGENGTESHFSGLGYRA